MLLSELGIKENRIKVLEKKGFHTVKDVLEFFPRTYYDFRMPKPLVPENNGLFCSVIGNLEKVETQKTNETLMVKAKVYDKQTNRKLHVMWIGAYYIYKMIKPWEAEDIIVCGKLTYNSEYNSYHMNNPIVFSKEIEKEQRIYPVYKKMSGISQDYMDALIYNSIDSISDTTPKELVTKHCLMDKKTAYQTMHAPIDFNTYNKAKARYVYDELLEFAIQVEIKEREISKGSLFNIKSLKNTNDYIRNLPFTLSDSQKHVIQEMQEMAKNGQRINALVQGDVGSGKTVVAFAMMMSMADSGYQSCLMAPTVILARQHYESLSKAAANYGYKTAFLSSDLTAREKKKILKEIADGEYTFVVGTHGVLAPTTIYKNLAMAIVDEEHKFGVEQRQILTGKEKEGVHSISISATPIPRTIANAYYGNSIQIYDLEVPEGRKPIQTAIFNNNIKIQEFIRKKIKEGQQAYIVSPFITDPDEQYNIETVEMAVKEYEKAFANDNIRVACITGKMKQEESDAIISDFADGKIHILIATTIIEVGVNVPNANVIVINNAERFGLAQLHQLRGRVGRGNAQGYCILKSSEKENPRLQTMCKTTNGFEIAKADMEQRGGGDILGNEQSGKNKYIDMIIKHPKIYEAAKEDAKIVVDNEWQAYCVVS